MRRVLLSLAIALPLITLAQLPAAKRLPNGWSLSPAGRSMPLGDLPLNMALTKKGDLLAVTNNGQSVQSIILIDPVKEKRLDSFVVPKSWYGLKFTADGKKLYASGGNDNRILEFTITAGKLKLTDSLLLGSKWPEQILPAGLDIDDKAARLYVVTQYNKDLYTFDLKTGAVASVLNLGYESYTCLLSPDRRTLYISLWGGDKVMLVDPINMKKIDSIPVGDNPNALLLSGDGSRLFVANANDNSVSVIDTKNRKVIETLQASLYPDVPQGSTTNGLALSPDGKTLYIANADNNCLAVFDVSVKGASRSKGFIPTGWYPTDVKTLGKKILVANGKGFTSMANPWGPNPVGRDEDVVFQKGGSKKPAKVQYIGGLFWGTLSIIDAPDEATLATYSKAVYANTPFHKDRQDIAEGEAGNPIPMKVGDASPIKHVFYIVKENRTYDQVLSDMPGGNGDTSLLLFGRKVTPNLHAIASEFVLLDNFYVDGEVSADGHNWSLGAYATDYLEKAWPTSYGGRGGTYDAEGNRAVANNKNGFIWDACRRKGVSYRTYGEFADNYKPNLPVLEGHYCTYYTSWDQTVRDTTRVSQWKRDFDSLLRAGAVPQMNTLRIINDHTEGQSIGRPTPFAHCADNDLAVGQFVEYLSQSPIWKESVVFVVEDDAQNGPDHVDAHRTTAYVAGGFVKRGFVDHTMYSTSSMLRTMELILGLPPMSQYDAAATPMWRSFSKEADPKGFTAKPAQIDLNDKNTKHTAMSAKSATFDFTKEDRIPDLEFNEVIWKTVKGEHVPMPAPVRNAFLRSFAGDDDDD